ncbi:wax ester/triacylglycerol synthase domain-containing protein [Mycobacterium sp.]|uniref:wax ester/triacylglycerol synthase domain-containing protein n=1 Tax=Mycobacterium sp. TaxID=1785 RepID=UPI0025F4EF4C|nr:wax ester/triacylglycerol synthase domain-containing protein [Mycobacterium sp.]
MPASFLTTVRSSAVDALRLLAEKSTTHGSTVSFVVMEPTDRLSHERLGRLIASALPQLTQLRSRLVVRPLGVGPPYWAEIEDYDPSPQIHRTTLDAPGGQRQFEDLIARICIRSPDRPEMLWEAWSVDGLPGGRWALVLRLSSVLAESGLGVASIWSRLLRSEPLHDGSEEQPRQPSADNPELGELAAEAVAAVLELQIKSLLLVAQTLTGTRRPVHDQPRGIHVVAERDSEPHQTSSGRPTQNAFTAPLTDRRAVAFASVRQADLETVSNAFGGDVTNVLLAACTLSLRAWLRRHDTVPDNPLVMSMPLSQSAGLIRVPVQLGDPVEVLTNLHSATESLNTALPDGDHVNPLSVDVAAIASLVPAPVLNAGMRLVRKLDVRQRLTPLSHGSVFPVPDEPLAPYCAGAEVVGLHTVTPLAPGCGLTITPTTHGDELHLSVCVCPDNVPAVNEIATGIVEALSALVTAARKSPRGQGRSVVTEMAIHASRRGQARA